VTPLPRSDPDSAEVATLCRPVGGPRLPLPAYRGRCGANLPSSVWQAVRGELPPRADGMLPPLLPSLDPFGGRRAPGPVVVLLVDGLGWFPFVSWAARAGAVGARWRAPARPITTVFPTTTTAALTSLSTGTAPGTHGLVGYRQYLPRFGVVADLLRMSPVGLGSPDQLVGPAFAPDLVSGVPSVFRRGLPAVAISRERFERSGFTRILYDGAAYLGYATAADLAHHLVRVLSRPRPPRVVYAYWDELDTIQHLHGPGRAELFGLELDRLAGLVDFVAAHLPSRRRRATTLLATGDHGQVAAAADRQIRVDQVPAVAREMAHPLAGDRRAGFFSARPGRRAALGRALRRLLPRGSRLLSMDAAVAFGLFGPGPYHPELASRLGDFLALVPTPWGLRDVLPGGAAPLRHLLGAHGGLAPEELVVPLIAGRLEQIAGRDEEPGQR
jgi:Type I phosphodiesterase / nucleotide pyrophosphatase